MPRVRKSFVGAAITTVFLIGAESLCAAPARANLGPQLEPIRAKAKLPALAAAVVRGDHIVAAGAVGLRKVGAPDAVTLDDQFHLGSCTKSMTATLAAMLVEKGRLSWRSTIGESFPEWAGIMHPDYRAATLEQLLSHHAGTPGDLLKTPIWQHAWQHAGEAPTDQRTFLVKEVLSQSPEAPPGSRYIYSNAGFAIAGTMIERREQKPWEELMRARLFDPLGMRSAGFGAAGRGNANGSRITQPWGHRLTTNGIVSIRPGLGADNPAAIGPAGTVHCSVLDFASYARFHLQGARGKGRLLRPETFARLHTPIGDDHYALGWFVAPRSWAKGRTFSHTGSNTMNTAVVWIAPEVDFAVVIVTNLGGGIAEKACDDVASLLVQQFLP